jgi:cytochrome c556
MKKAVSIAALAALGLSVALDAAAQAKPEDLVKQRKAAFTLTAKYFAPIGAMVQGKAPYDAAVVARNAGYLEVLSKMPWDGFQASTADVKDTRAKPEAYREMDKFNAGAEKMQAEIAKLASAAKAGDQNAVKAAFGAVGQSCKACHDAYRRD